MKRHCLALDLKNDEALIAKYEEYHREVWPEVLDSLQDSGIVHMEIYRIGNRLFMIIEVEDSFSFEKKAQMDADNEKVQDWEVLMWDYQQALPMAKPGEKWLPMEKIFDFKAS
ncbi:L-rhamnose mutarotase [Ulvibacterium marinum]|uniref:L-rhamnose mutarotase n=1 Tax=Ulvibacterium marinum TaxID=2419782 RepID=A0A3B0CF96_9FLAO|nr:L-rhamnose mutarotase [Ulvibacterium marinum]RKN81766.1 L-rhamnose mutarotase [Ulvibacterium marinum]